jgi:hypothetical protein
LLRASGSHGIEHSLGLGMRQFSIDAGKITWKNFVGFNDWL